MHSLQIIALSAIETARSSPKHACLCFRRWSQTSIIHHREQKKSTRCSRCLSFPCLKDNVLQSALTLCVQNREKSLYFTIFSSRLASGVGTSWHSPVTSYPFATTDTALSFIYATFTTTEIATAPPGILTTTLTGEGTFISPKVPAS
jgi:hypothetical protein